MKNPKTQVPSPKPPPGRNSPAMLNVFARIAAERLRQRDLIATGKIRFACESPTVADDRKLRVLVEEVGEVAQEIDRLEEVTRRREETPLTFSLRLARRREFLREELVQVAAVAVAWLESLEGKEF